MKSFVQVLFLTFSLAACADPADAEGPFNDLEARAKAVLLEMCGKGQPKSECARVNEEIDNLMPEVYRYEDERKKEVLVLFTLDDFYPHVVFSYIKSDGTEMITWGTRLFAEKERFITLFKHSGTHTDYE